MKKLKISTEVLKAVKNDFEKGYPVAIPTDTNYNFLCDPCNEEAIKRVFEYKKREFNKPLSLFVYDPQEIYKYAKDYDYNLVKTIIDNFLPGPLNIILNKDANEFDKMLNGSDSISFGSIKNHNWRKIVEYLDTPVAITSANISGTADNTLVDEKMLINQMDEKLEYYIEDVEKENTKSSTIIKIENKKIVLIREGEVLIKHILNKLKEIGVDYEH